MTVTIEVIAIQAFKRTIAVVKDNKHTSKLIQNVIGLFVKILRESVIELFLMSEVNRKYNFPVEIVVRLF